ncbi:hypothetical protein GGR42_002186 [Saonia flava]|uniref:FeoB-associated Cys-rich membrane protein n=1 Tax=Saonia flava TaxID=523696 RepID=A0A846R2Y0_9FLAO|nr:hypothetical protein [Saonia flava]NJB71724.1 hypothetical protein [Saonia flava]
MDIFQNIVVYLILAAAIAYLVKTYFLPKKLFSSKKGKDSACGNDNCGCH